jgi:molecular chaperone GrpE
MDDSGMSKDPKNPEEEMVAASGAEPPKGPTIAASDEMAQALFEAAQAVEEENAGQAAEADGDAPAEASNDLSPDKLTIEMLSTELQDLKTLHETKLKEAEEQSEQHLRLQAEFENFRRRSLKEKQESFKYGHQNLVKDLLSAVDNLERALEHGAQKAGAEVQGILDGVELVHREILGGLAKHGVSEIQAEGQLFDPAFHEAMGQIPNGDVPANTVLQVLQKGYLIHDRMVRPARVIVSKEQMPEEAATANSGDSD